MTTGRATPAVTGGDWSVLDRELLGQVVHPGDATYDTVRLVCQQQFDHIKPDRIIRAANTADVATAVRFLGRAGLTCRPRGGGHSYAGYGAGPGVVLDVSGLDRIDSSPTRVRVGAGTQLVDLYVATLADGVIVPTGWCPTVSVAGLTMGGGIGLEARKHGLAIDRLRSVEAVLADGQVVRCDENHHPDLFWALRGCGGGNLAVVTELEFEPVPAGDATTYKLYWGWDHAADVVLAWQDWLRAADDDLAAIININVAWSGSQSRPQVTVAGIWHGDPAALNAVLADLEARVGVAADHRTVSTRDYLSTMMDWFDAGDLTPAEAHLVGYSPQAKLPRYPFALARGAFLREPLGPSAVADFLSAFAAHRYEGQVRGLHLIGLGGACNRVAPDATAFVHRDSLCYAGYSVGIDPDVSPTSRTVARRWVDEAWETAHAWSAGGFSYQNFIDPAIPDWRHAYYGANYERLSAVRARYDPTGFFAFPLAID